MSCGPVKTRRSAASGRRSATLTKRNTVKAKQAALVHAKMCAAKTRRSVAAGKIGSSGVPQKAQKAQKAAKAQKAQKA